jgi:hypothetical protein
LSVEMTTGMSAPPIGSTARFPSTALATSQQDEQPLALGRPRRDPGPIATRGQHRVDDDPASSVTAARDELLELGEGTFDPQNEIRADNRREDERGCRNSSTVRSPPRREHAHA